MDTPQSCDVCPCLDDYGDYPRCRISGEQRGYNFPIREKRMPNCPIICQLPEGHGSLVDAEILRAKLIEHIAETNGFVTAFNETQTIVPAERSRI
jgi:hypothetical protein